MVSGGGTALIYLWYVITVIQGLFAYGTAYRFTKKGGDNGVALFGWMLVFGLAAAVPGLGIYLWYRYKDDPYVNRYGSYTSSYGSYEKSYRPPLIFPLIENDKKAESNEEDNNEAESTEEIIPCPFCGEQILREQKFCQYCGGNVKDYFYKLFSQE